MAYQDKKAVKGLSPIEAGFVRFYEMAEKALRDVNKNYKNMNIQDPKPPQRNPRNLRRPFVSPFEGDF